MRINRRILTVTSLLAALALFGGLAAPDGGAPGLLRGLVAIPAAHADGESEPYAAYREALDVLKNEYYGAKIDAPRTRELTYAAIRGMLFSLNDPFTSFLDPDDWEQMRQTTRGDFEGIGAVLEQMGQDVKVVRPIEDSPAWKAGIKSNDVIISVGTHHPKTGKLLKTTATLGKDINEVVKLIKGPKGTKVTVTVMRKGQSAPISFELTRAHIEPPTVRYWMEDDKHKIGHIMLTDFYEKSDAHLQKAWDALEKQGMRALVFDLRDNPGGLLDIAVDVGSRFVDRGPVVVIQEKNGQRQPLRVRRAQPRRRIPLVVLINGNSASASEIVAGAVKDNGTGILVGEHTFGKGLVQTIFTLSDGSALRLTTAKYLTPNLHDINNKYDDEHRMQFGTGGIKPDIEVKLPEDFDDQDWSDENRRKDVQLQKALEVLRSRLAQAGDRAAR